MNIIKRILNKILREWLKFLQNVFFDRTMIVEGFILDNSHYRIKNRKLYPVREEQEMFIFLDMIDKSDVFWDIGANIGYFSLYVAKKRKAKVVAFDPDTLTCSILNKNIYLNNLSDYIIALPVALNDINSINYLYMRDFLPANAYNTFSSNKNHRGKEFKQEFKQGSIGFTGEFLVNTNSEISHPSAVKIDVDGNELKVLKGLGELLKGVRILAIELAYDHPDYEECISILSKNNFIEIGDSRLFNEKRDQNSMRNFYFHNKSFC